MDKFRRYGPIMKEEYQKGYPAVTIFDPNDIRELYMREEVCPMRPVPPFVIKHRASDPKRYPNVGLANMMGEEWLKLRSELAPLLLCREFKERHIGPQNVVATSLVKYMNHLMFHDNNKSEVNVETRKQQNQNSRDSSLTLASLSEGAGGVIDNIQDVFYRFSIESILVMSINQSLGCLSTQRKNSSASQLDGEIIFKAALDFFEAQHKLYYGSSLWKYYNTKPYKQLQNSLDLIYDISARHIDKAIRRLKADDREIRDRTLVGMLYSKTKFNDLEIKSTVVDFIGGGIYTMSNTLTMTLFLLAGNQSVQEQLFREIRDNCPPAKDSQNPNDIEVDVDTLDNLKFLKCCLKESYRLLPTIPGIARLTQRDMVLSNYKVPKGTLVFSNFMVTCRLPQYFKDPNTYNPSRWIRNGESKSDMAFSVLPFGHGVRKCIGHNFAEIEMYLALAKIIKHFRVEPVDSSDIDSLDLSYKFIIIPEKPVRLRFVPREHPPSAA